MSDIFLVNSPVNEPLIDRHAGLSPPLGLGYIASLLLENGFSVSATDPNVRGSGFEMIERRIEKADPQILGISAHTESYPNALKIAAIAKQIKPQIVTVLGGPHVTVMYEQALQNEQIDIVVRGEGEFAMLELSKHFLKDDGELDSMPGIAYKEDGEIKVNNPRPWMNDLDTLPFPARFLFPLWMYKFPGNILSARGCPYNCIYCAAGAVCGRKYRTRSLTKLLEEMFLMYNESETRYFSFADDTFTVDKDRVFAFCDMLDKTRSSSLGLPMVWSCSTRVNLVNKELLKRMAEVNCVDIQFGIESGSQKVLDSVRKGTTLDQVRDAVGAAIKANIRVLCSFMIPHPEDTEETIRETQQLIIELQRMGASITMSCTAPYPGTYLYDHAQELGIKILTDDWGRYDAKRNIISTRNLASHQIEELIDETIRSCGLVKT